MAFAFVHIFEGSTATKIHDYARVPDEINVRVIFQHHFLLQDEEYLVTLPRNACAGDLQRYMAEIPMSSNTTGGPPKMDYYVGGNLAEMWRQPAR